jgi:transposase
MTGPRPVEVQVTIKRRRKLNQVISAATSPQRLVLRARIVLAAEDGDSDAEIARALGCGPGTAGKWRKRFAAEGVPGIFDRPRSGRPEVHGPSAAAGHRDRDLGPAGRGILLVALVDRPSPARPRPGHVQGDRRAGPGRRGRPPAQGPRLAQPRRRPAFWAQAGKVCRLYLDPEPGTVLVSIDEKTGIQAKTRIRPDIPGGPGRPARREFEYRRHGTVSIIAAMNVRTGEVITPSVQRNNSEAFTQFLAMLDQCTAPGLQIHLIMDNGSNHASKATRAWIAAHPGFAVTHTPKHASWLNMVEQWFSILTRKLLRRGDFTSRDDLDGQITDFTIGWNETAHPFKWKYDADAEHARYLEHHPSQDALSQAA